MLAIDCWCWVRHGYKWLLEFELWICYFDFWLRQSVSRSMDLILSFNAPQHRQLDFISFPSIFGGAGRNSLSNIPSDEGCAAVRESLLLPPITTWWVPADYVGLVIGIVNIVNYSAESNQTNSITFCLHFDYISAYWNGSWFFITFVILMAHWEKCQQTQN